MDPVTMAILQIAPYLIDPIAQAIPGPLEEQYRKDIESERKDLQTNQGGLSAGQRTAFRSEGQNAIQSQQMQNLAMLARGSALGGDAGAAGLQGNAIRDTFRMGAQQGNQLESGIRAQDIAEYGRKKAAYDERVKHAMEQGYRRKQDALKATADSTEAMSSAFTGGQNARLAAASQVAGGADAVAAAVPPPVFG